MSDKREERWAEEQRFFDRQASRVQVEPIDPLVLKRYTQSPLRRRFRTEFRLRMMGDLKGKRVLDVGCNDGSNSVLFGLMGARVTGVDISQGSIDVARKRAEVNGVAHTVDFICSPVEVLDLPENTFDFIYVHMLLHHVIADLDPVMNHLVRWAKPDALLLLEEPVNLVAALRRLRMSLAGLVPVSGTPDERPLEKPEITILSRHFADTQIRFYRFLTRLPRLLGTSVQYEHLSPLGRQFHNLLALVDYWLLSLPGVQLLGSEAVMLGRPQKHGVATSPA